MSEASAPLDKIQSEVDKTLEKISSREKYINGQFEPQARHSCMLVMPSHLTQNPIL